MIKIEFFIPFENYLNSNLFEFETVIKNAPKKRIGSVSVEELCAVRDYPHGLYLLFSQQNTLWYVGKATSRSFIERLPAHFDVREDAWFNTVSKYIKRDDKIHDYNSAIDFGLNLEVLLIGIKYKAVSVRLEKVLRSYLKPRLNSCAGDFSPDSKMAMLTNYIESASIIT